MIAISSARFVSDPHNEYFINQSAANKSWQKIFKAIVYFGPFQEHLAGPNVLFYTSEQFPRLMELAEVAACQKDWSVILNSDIVVPTHFIALEKKLKDLNASAASSWRWEFDPARGLEPCQRVDNGLDFFAANQQMWIRVYNDAPQELRIGAIQWDSWLLGYFGAYARRGFYDLTPNKVVFHPRHNSRAYGPAPPPVHFHGWPNMPSETLR